MFKVFIDLYLSIEFMLAVVQISTPEMPGLPFKMPLACFSLSKIYNKEMTVFNFPRTLMTLYHALLSSLFGSLPSFWSP